MAHVSPCHTRATAMAKLIIITQPGHGEDNNKQQKSPNPKDKRSSDQKTRKQHGLNVCLNDISSHPY